MAHLDVTEPAVEHAKGVLDTRLYRILQPSDSVRDPVMGRPAELLHFADVAHGRATPRWTPRLAAC